MSQNLLILGGTTEATALCHVLAEQGRCGTVSFAGRVDRPVRQPLPQRIGGFGGADGLVDHIRAEGITHLIDATHPFAAQMSRNAVAAAGSAGIPMIALTRAPWSPKPGDRWQSVADISAAVTALQRPAARVMLAVGRMHLEVFAPNPQHFYLLRLVDPPRAALPFPDAHVLVSRGPFTADEDRALMERYRIDLVVSKNAGGTGAYAKIEAARSIGIPVIMIDRPAMPRRAEAHSVEDVVRWLDHADTDLGV
ncbi:MAG: cobalt-precorrin-6A reductase [Pseudomonadota bacterium]